MEIRARHWLVAVPAAALAHLALVAVGVRSAPEPPQLKPVTIQLSAAGSLAGPAGDGPARALLTGAAPAAAVGAASPLSALAASETLQAQVVEPPSRPATTPKPKAQPRPQPRTAPARAQSKPPAQPPAQPKPKAQAKPQPKPKPSAAPPRSRPPARPDAAGAGSGSGRGADAGRAGAGRGAGAGAGSSGRGSGQGGSGGGKARGAGGGSANVSNYQGKLAAWLARHKRYPNAARRMRQQGTVRVSFTIDRRGRVLSHRIVSSSGHTLLDQEVGAMLKRASPFPAIPSGITQSQMTITVPIRFNLR